MVYSAPPKKDVKQWKKCVLYTEDYSNDKIWNKYMIIKNFSWFHDKWKFILNIYIVAHI